MKTRKSCNSEFDLYESILSGSRQRFLPGISYSNIHFEEIIKEKATKNENKLKKSGLDMRFSLDLGQVLTKSKRSIINKLKEREDFDIPPPPDPKALYLLSLIENEFDEIKKRAQKLLDQVQKEEQISQFADQNIQKAKKLAIDSGHLSRLLKSEDSATLN